MNDEINIFLLLDHQLAPEMHFKKLGFTCSSCELFNKHIKLNKQNYMYLSE